jgi:hypothetical protein
VLAGTEALAWTDGPAIVGVDAVALDEFAFLPAVLVSSCSYTNIKYADRIQLPLPFFLGVAVVPASGVAMVPSFAGILDLHQVLVGVRIEIIQDLELTV